MLNRFFGGKKAKDANEKVVGGLSSKADLDQLLEQAMGQVQAGNVAEGVQTILGAVSNLEKERESPLLAHSYYNAAVVCLSTGQESGAVEFLKKASSIVGKDKEAQKDRLTYLMNLGDILTRLGETVEAEKVLRSGLEEREYFYGDSHPGVAFGLTPLAANLLAQNRAKEAAPLIERAVNINVQAGQPEVAGDLALQSFIVKAALGADSPAFEGWETWPVDLQQRVFDEVIERANDVDDKELAAIACKVVDELAARSLENIESTGRINMLVVGMNASRIAEDHEARVLYGKQILQHGKQTKDVDLAISACESLALAYSDLGNEGQTDKAYQMGFKLAKQSGDSGKMANVLRNYGLWQAEEERNDKAADILRNAVKASMQSGNKELEGRCLVALGIFRQHQNQNDSAKSVLTKSISLLPVAHPDRFCAMSHLIALKNNSSCPCNGETGAEAAGQILEEIVRGSLPDGLLKKISFGEGVEVELAREPSEEEALRLNELLQTAMGQMRMGLGLSLMGGE